MAAKSGSLPDGPELSYDVARLDSRYSTPHS
jgi:hypothetical protein